MKLTAAGTVEDLHLFPSQDFTEKVSHYKFDGKDIFFYEYLFKKKEF